MNLYVFVRNNPINRIDALGLNDDEAMKQLKKQEEDFLRQPIPRIHKPRRGEDESQRQQRDTNAKAAGETQKREWVTLPSGQKILKGTEGQPSKSAADYNPESPKTGSPGLYNIPGKPHYDPTKPPGAPLPWRNIVPRMVAVKAIAVNDTTGDIILETASDARVSIPRGGLRIAALIESKRIEHGGKMVPISMTPGKQSVTRIPGNWQILYRGSQSDEPLVLRDEPLVWTARQRMIDTFATHSAAELRQSAHTGGAVGATNPGIYTVRLHVEQLTAAGQPDHFNIDVNITAER